jgi:enoyl-CoA hydratase/carnithine racemase
VSDNFIVTRDGDVTTILVNKADDGNRFSDAMAVEMAGLLDTEAAKARMILFKAAGPNFCTGRAGGPPPASIEAYDFRDGFAAVFNCYDSFRRCKAPIVGIVQGKALGFGCSLAALCDVTIAADTATFALPETGHGIMPTAAMSALIDRVGRKALMNIAYTATEISAEDARVAGIVSQVVPAAQLEEAATAFVAKMKKIPKPAVLAVKEFTMNGMGLSNNAMLAFAQNLHSVVNSFSKLKS